MFFSTRLKTGTRYSTESVNFRLQAYILNFLGLSKIVKICCGLNFSDHLLTSSVTYANFLFLGYKHSIWTEFESGNKIIMKIKEMVTKTENSGVYLVLTLVRALKPKDTQCIVKRIGDSCYVYEVWRALDAANPGQANHLS